MIDVYIDFDGVLAKCHETVLMLEGCQMEPNKPMYQIVNEQVGSSYTRDAFWDMFGHDFWASLPKTGLCDTLLEWVTRTVGQERTFFLTRPTGNTESFSGKAGWTKRNLPPWAINNLFIGTRKDKLAPNSILIDDSPSNIEAWKDNGGLGILVPRPWNGKPSDDAGVVKQFRGMMHNLLAKRGPQDNL